MKAAVLTSPAPISRYPLKIEDAARPAPKPGHVLLRVLACGVCRTDLHIVEGELPPLNPRIIPGHQIVGEVVAGDLDFTTDHVGTGAHARPVEPSSTRSLPTGTRVGVSWMGGIDGTCPYCRRGEDNLCDSPTFTGYTVNGGYAEYALARADFVFPIPAAL
ncbi:MAG: alcohol dehydrogenase, propanol-preferring, partial [Acidobacteriaceae bacterium]